MNCELSPQLEEFQQSVRKYVEERVLPQIMEYEEESTFPREMMREMGARGFLKAHMPKEVGGRRAGHHGILSMV